MNRTSKASICTVVILLSALTVSAAEWNMFRGPNGSGLAPAATVAVDFGPDKNVLWKTPIPPGQSSPVIFNDRIFFTACEPRNKKELITLCLDRNTGEILWQKTIHTETVARYHGMNGPASSTPTADKNNVYFYFPTWGLLCYDHDGEKIWDRKLEAPKNHFGTAASLLLHKNKLILLLDSNDGKSRLLAIDKKSGKDIWQQPRPLNRAGWSTPMIWRHHDKEEIIVLGFKRLTSYDPETGNELWWAGGFSPETMGIPVAGDGLLFVSAAAMAGRGDDKWDTSRSWSIITERFDKNKDNQIQRDEMTDGFTIPLRPDLAYDNPGWGLPTKNMEWLMSFFDKSKDRIITEEEWKKTVSGFSMDSQPQLLAIRPGAKDDARKEHLAWENHRGMPETPSIIYCRKKLYLLRDGGQLTCLDAKTGKELFREKIGAAGQYTASPVIAGDKLITASVRGTVTVLQVDDKLNVLAKTEFEEKIYATPAITDNKIYLRTNDHLYAIGN